MRETIELYRNTDAKLLSRRSGGETPRGGGLGGGRRWETTRGITMGLSGEGLAAFCVFLHWGCWWWCGEVLISSKIDGVDDDDNDDEWRR